MSPVRLVNKKGSTFHDFPYSSPQRKCLHCWIVNVTPPGPEHCRHRCLYCYARGAIYSDYSEDTLIYNNLPELVEKDLRKLNLCPPVSISNISDPCQDIPELRSEVVRLVRVLMDYGVSFAITTKGDPTFLLDLPGFAGYEPKLIAITIEGTGEILRLLSPQAPPFDARLSAVSRLSGLGIHTVVRFDPVFIHLFQALYGDSWFGKVAGLVDAFSAAGAGHLVSSTGRLSRRPDRAIEGKGESAWQRVFETIRAHSPPAAAAFAEEYRYEVGWAGRGYMLRRDLRLEFHRRVRELAEARGMTYATCQELSAAESDSEGIAHCEGFPLPFSARGLDGRFHSVPGCTANCHVTCRGSASPPCGRPALVTCKPLHKSVLR